MNTKTKTGLMGWLLSLLPGRRELAWPRPAQRLKPEEVLAEFDLPMDNPLWQALHQELDDAIADVLDEVTQPPSALLTAERRVHLAGGAEELRKLQRRLLDLQRRANAADEELGE